MKTTSLASQSAIQQKEKTELGGTCALFAGKQ